MTVHWPSFAAGALAASVLGLASAYVSGFLDAWRADHRARQEVARAKALAELAAETRFKTSRRGE